MLDALASAGEVRWVGVAGRGNHDATVMLFLTDSLPNLWAPVLTTTALAPEQQSLLQAITQQGAMFAPALEAALPVIAAAAPMSTSPSSTLPKPSFAQWQAQRHGAVASGDTASRLDEALWPLVWSGLVTNDTFRPLRARLTQSSASGAARRQYPRRQQTDQAFAFRSRRQLPQHLEGRWSLTLAASADAHQGTALTRRAAAVAEQLLVAHGVVSNDAIAVALEQGMPIAAAAVKSALRLMEDAGRIRRGYFVDGASGLQYGSPAAVEALRHPRSRDDGVSVVLLSAVDPASPWGAHLPWPTRTLLPGVDAGPGLARAVGALVVVEDGRLVGFVAAGAKRVVSFLPALEPERSDRARGLADGLSQLARRRRIEGRTLVIGEVDGCVDAGLATHPIAQHLQAVGFMRSAGGYVWPKDAATVSVRRAVVEPKVEELTEADDDADDGSAPWDSVDDE
jgi:ATP-dependent helicase Lhr and Lhr-like helicase